MKGLLQYKELGGAVTDVDLKNRVVTGYGAKFGNEDAHNDIIESGAFTKTLGENRDNLFFLNQHNFNQPHSKLAVAREDDYGLYFESEPLIKGVSYSDDALKLMDAGVIDSFSIGYVTEKSEDKSGIRHLKELKLYEISNVTIPANDGAKITGIKGLTLAQVNDKVKKIMRVLKSGDLTDDGFRLLELSLKDLQAASYNLGQKALNERKPLPGGTYADVKPQIDTINDFINKF